MTDQYQAKLTKRFWQAVQKSPTCWFWTMSLLKGYGQISVVLDGKRNTVLATHVAWYLEYGHWPGTKRHGGRYMICHTCDNTLCVRPSHLYEGTNTTNMRDRHLRTVPLNGMGNGRSKLTERDVAIIRATYRLGLRNGLQLAVDYSVSKSTVYAVLYRTNWRHI